MAKRNPGRWWRAEPSQVGLSMFTFNGGRQRELFFFGIIAVLETPLYGPLHTFHRHHLVWIGLLVTLPYSAQQQRPNTTRGQALAVVVVECTLLGTGYVSAHGKPNIQLIHPNRNLI